MPTQKPHSSSYSLKDLILVGSIIKFALSVTAAFLMRQRNGTVNGAVNDTLWAIAVVVMFQGFLGSVASWVDNRKQEERLHETLEEWDALWATNSSRNTSSAQLSITGPIDVVTAGNGQDGQADIDQSVAATDLSATSTNTPSPTIVASTYSSTFLPGLGEPLLLSQVENSGQNDGSIQINKGDDVGWETLQLTPALAQRNITRDVAPSGKDPRSSASPPAPGISVLADVKGTIEESSTTSPAVTDQSEEMDTHGNQYSSTEEIGLLSRDAGPNSGAAGCDSRYSELEETEAGQRRTITHDDPLTTGATSSIFVTSSTLRSATNSSLAFEADNFEVNQGMHPTTEGDGAGKQEHMEAIPSGKLSDAAVGLYEEQIAATYGSPLTSMRRDTGATSPSPTSQTFRLVPGEASGGEKQEHVEVTPDIVHQKYWSSRRTSAESGEKI
ncbi:hypothetical protein BDP27DRAFT_1405908 [Rhodocollybia butyracea]|uniref:Uncharacterized protein n=1 Tax=Rhodocollybia butyracea TaxID=206335 RepID=A0A9P5U278_9AGAR|nr:hypothetical protein BDP27DRAFT_1405908 [Rhodocollybia butyracea]